MRTSLVLALIAGGGMLVHAGPPPGAGATTTGCEITIRGMWKPESTVEANPLLLSFSADGWVSVLSGASEASVHELDIASQVQYRIDASSNPARIEFLTKRGDDVFPPGKSTWDVVTIDDRILAVINRQTGEPLRWVRVATHRYFLTLAQRPATKGADGAAIAMWTNLDGRRPELSALGVRERVGPRGDRTLVFGRIPASLAAQFTREGGETTTMLRMELTDSEYARTRAVFDAWVRGSVASALAFFGDTAASLNRCGERMQVPALTPATDDADARRAWDFIRELRRLNDRQHVADSSFPFTWQPPPVR